MPPARGAEPCKASEGAQVPESALLEVAEKRQRRGLTLTEHDLCVWHPTTWFVNVKIVHVSAMHTETEQTMVQ